MNVKKLTLVAVVISSLFFTGCFNKEVTCETNDIDLNSRLIGLDRNEVIKILGEPSHSDLGIKLFDEYSYSFAHKHYSVIVKYDSKNRNEPPRLYRRVDCLSQAALSDSVRLS